MKTFLVLTLCILPATALAENARPACNSYISAEKYSGVIPKTFSIVPTCPDAKGPDGFASSYLFVGEAEITGHIQYDPETMGHPHFVTDKKSQHLLPTWTTEFKLFSLLVPHTEDFHFPNMNLCWSAPATILVKQIELDNDGSDSSGSYLLDYRLLSLGKYIACGVNANNKNK